MNCPKCHLEVKPSNDDSESYTISTFTFGKVTYSYGYCEKGHQSMIRTMQGYSAIV